MFKLSKKSFNNMQGVDPRLRQIAERAIAVTRIDFGIPSDGGVRTAARQHELFRIGASKCDGYDRKSKHQLATGDVFSKAIDFYAYVNKKASWRLEHMSLVACAFLQSASELGYSVEWGGLWITFQDTPHIQINDGFI